MHVSEPLTAKYIYIDERGRRVRRGMTMLSQRRETREELATRLLDYFIGVLDGLGSLTAARHSGSSSCQNINIPLKIHCSQKFMPLQRDDLRPEYLVLSGMWYQNISTNIFTQFSATQKMIHGPCETWKKLPKRRARGEGARLTYTRLTNYYQKIYELYYWKHDIALVSMLPLHDKRKRTNNKQRKIELLSQWIL